MSQEGPGNQKSRIEVSQVPRTFKCQSRGPKQDPPGKLSGDFRIHKLEKIVGGGGEKESILQGSVKCVLHIRSEVKLETCVNSTLFSFTMGPCFEKYHSVTTY